MISADTESPLDDLDNSQTALSVTATALLFHVNIHHNELYTSRLHNATSRRKRQRQRS
jgi:hypothetical protein